MKNKPVPLLGQIWVAYTIYTYKNTSNWVFETTNPIAAAKIPMLGYIF